MTCGRLTGTPTRRKRGGDHEHDEKHEHGVTLISPDLAQWALRASHVNVARHDGCELVRGIKTLPPPASFGVMIDVVSFSRHSDLFYR